MNSSLDCHRLTLYYVSVYAKQMVVLCWYLSSFTHSARNAAAKVRHDQTTSCLVEF